MKSVAIALQEFIERARAIAGSDEVVVTSFEDLSGVLPADLVLIYLHPSADGRAWVDAQGAPVLTLDQVQVLELGGSIIFVGACYGLENERLLEALFAAGARAIIAGPGPNVGGQAGFAGADILATALRAALQIGLPLWLAWGIARTYVMVAAVRQRPGAQDALEYQLIMPRRGAGVVGGGLFLLMMLCVSVMLGGVNTNLLTFNSSVLPTYTPDYTPAPWPTTTYPTPTPCSGLGCNPSVPRITYDLYLPAIMR